MSAPSRRAALAAALAMGAIGPAAAAALAAHPDAELLRLCSLYPGVRAAFEADDGDYEDCVESPAWGPYDRVLEAILAADPLTLDGIVAWARIAESEAVMPGCRELWGDSPAGMLAVATVKDLLRLHRGSAKGPVGEDAQHRRGAGRGAA